jgi:hypothetical protein
MVITGDMGWLMKLFYPHDCQWCASVAMASMIAGISLNNTLLGETISKNTPRTLLMKSKHQSDSQLIEFMKFHMLG